MAHQSHTTEQVFARAITGLTSKELKMLVWYHAERLAVPETKASAERYLTIIEDERRRRCDAPISKNDRPDPSAVQPSPFDSPPESPPCG